MAESETIKSIIILSGPVGAGKSTVARELISILPGPIASIEGDTFWSFIVRNEAEPRRDKNFKTVMLSMTAAAVPYALAGHEVILDFSIPPWFIDTARKIANLRNVPLDYVVLRPAETICAARAAARTEGTIADYKPYHDLYLSFDEATRYTIREDTGDAMSAALRIRDGLNKGIFRVS